MAKKNYEIYNINFTSKKDVEATAREILYKDIVDTYLNKEDFNFMMAYFEYFHIDWEQKKGQSGIKHIIRKNDNWRKPCFWIKRYDDSETDISFKISSIEKKNFYREFSAAMREAVHDQIRDFKKNSFLNNEILICPINNIEVTINQCHVDHHNPSFDDLVKQFIDVNKVKLTNELFPPSEDGRMHYMITDNNLTKGFYDFHLSKARLRITSANGNLSKKKL